MDSELLAAYKLIAAQEPTKMTSTRQLANDEWNRLDEINQSIYYARMIVGRSIATTSHTGGDDAETEPTSVPRPGQGVISGEHVD